MTKSTMNEYDKFIAKKLRLLRLSKGARQQEVADLLNVSFQQIQKYEEGKNKIGPGNLYKIAKAFKTNISYFFDGIEDLQVELDENNDLSKTDLRFSKLISQINNPKVKKNVVALVQTIVESEDNKQVEENASAEEEIA